MDLSIITVTWNSEKLIQEQIQSVKSSCTSISFEEIVIDNNSPDKTIEVVKKFPEVILIENKENRGFAFANNQGAKLAKGEFLLFLNPDMHVAPGSLDIMVGWMKKHPDVGLASCKLVDKEGNLQADAQPRRLPKVIDQVAILLKIHHIFPFVLSNYLYKDFDANKEQEVDSVRGAFMIMRKEVYEKLGFAYDPRYFIWFEDVDLCREVKKLGLKVVHTPVINCIDYFGQSFKQRTTLWKQNQFTKSMLTYFKKWEPWYKWLWIAIMRPIAIFLVWFGEKVNKK